MEFANSGNNNQQPAPSLAPSESSNILQTTIVAWKSSDENRIPGSLLADKDNCFSVLKIHPPVRDSFFDDHSSSETIYVQRSEQFITSDGIGTSKEELEMLYRVHYFVHVDTQDDARKLVTNLPFDNGLITAEQIAKYAAPAIEQAISQIQITPWENFDEHISEAVKACRQHLGNFLPVFGISLDDLRVFIIPRNHRLRTLIPFQSLGLTERRALQHYLSFGYRRKKPA